MERREDLEDAADDGPHRDQVEERDGGDTGPEERRDAGHQAPLGPSTLRNSGAKLTNHST
jgi:hypothetical protein